jgi:hypothetical protein
MPAPPPKHVFPWEEEGRLVEIDGELTLTSVRGTQRSGLPTGHQQVLEDLPASRDAEPAQMYPPPGEHCPLVSRVCTFEGQDCPSCPAFGAAYPRAVWLCPSCMGTRTAWQALPYWADRMCEVCGRASYLCVGAVPAPTSGGKKPKTVFRK